MAAHPAETPDRHWAAALTFGQLPGEAARRFGEREALAFGERRYSFRQVSDEVDRLARGLLHLGIQPGEHVSLWLNNCPEWMFAMLALAKVGAVHVPLNTRFRVADLEYVLRQSDSTTLITHDRSGPIDYLAMARALLPASTGGGDTVESPALPAMRRLIIKSEARHAGTIAWSDLCDRGREVTDSALAERAARVRMTDTAFIMYTSGTTGFPKGVMRDHTIIGSLIDRQRRLAISPRDVFINYLPLFHIFGYVDGPLGTLLGGFRQVLTETFDPDEALDLVEREGGTLVNGFETHMKALTDAQEARPRNIATLRAGIAAVGMASAAPIAWRARKILAPLRQISAYGITEVGANVSMADLDCTDEQACESSGRACSGFDLRVIDPETGQDQPMGTPGELIVRSRYMMLGYYRKPEETARAIDSGGWFHTGDMALLRPDGYMRFIGRYKDMLKVGGENVDPMEVEGYLLRHQGLRQVAVVGHPDAKLGEVPVAFVSLRPGAQVSGDELIDACRGRIASFKIPRHIFFMDDLPETSSGKIRKVDLREEARRRLSG